MSLSRICAAASLFSLFVLLLLPGRLEAAGGTSKVATKGQLAYVPPSWPEGAAEIVNDLARTDGWNDWFSEWSNDVNHYGFQIASVDDLNRLMRKLAAVKADLVQVRLAPTKEPAGLGWVTRLPPGNQVPVLFSIGDQKRIDAWFGRLNEGRFGVMQFEAPPIAVPPTLTVFVQHKTVDLAKLEVPDGIEVSMGNCPRVFHRWNTHRERERNRQKPDEPIAKSNSLDPATQRAADEIHEFLMRREQDGNKGNERDRP